MCATKLIMSYFTQRSKCVKLNGSKSSFHKSPGGGPQGGLLTGVLFCLQVNKAGSPCAVPRLPVSRQEHAHDPATSRSQPPSSRQEPIHGPANRIENGTLLPPCHKQDKLHKKSYIDDLTMLEKISLSNLIKKEKIIGPLNWHDRFELTLPADKFILQHKLQDLQVFTNMHFMKLNSKKTKCMPFINSLTKDFEPRLSLEDGKYLEVIYQMKLVGLVISSDMTWNAHVSYTVSRVNSVIWQLVRFKNLGAPRDKLI